MQPRHQPCAGRAGALDTEARRPCSTTAARLTYDRLLIATGSPADAADPGHRLPRRA